ncbi:MAG: hypothetical protein HUJ56_04805, partial [Erysipelotrichaceae bacterium]|nr:hypothetical protein [Erysipelotrichaceae bacterium]
MNKRFIFCEECRTEGGMYTISEVPMTSTIRGVEYKYMGKEVRCLNCNSYLYFPDIIDENLEALYKVYRKENGFVSLDVVRAIPEKYSIGKRPLSLLLGWGELTFTRFYDGDMPTRQYSDILIRIYEDPNYFAELLEAGKDKLKSKAAYEKSKKALQKLTNP